MEQDIKKLELLNKELELELKLVKNNLKKEKEKLEKEKLEKEEQICINKDLSIKKQEIQERLDKILYSRSYKLTCKIKKIIGRK